MFEEHIENLFDGVALPGMTKTEATQVLRDYLMELRTAFDDDEYVLKYNRLQEAVSVAIGAINDRIDVAPGFDSIRR